MTDVVRWLILVVFLLPLAVRAQETITGKVTDAKTGEGIPFAHVVAGETNRGVVTDLFGIFVLPVPAGAPAVTLSASCIGYKTRKVTVRGGTPSLVIALELDVIQLKEVVIQDVDAKGLIREAIRRVPENYDTTATQLSGYYKVSSILDNKTAHYVEAFLEIFKPAYVELPGAENRHADSILITEARMKQQEIHDWKLEVMMPWERSIYFLEHRDVAKDFISRKKLNEVFLSSYDFDLENTVVVNGRKTYMIRLVPRKNRKEAYWNGHIFLDEETKAVVKWETVSTPAMFRRLRGDLGYIILSKLYRIHYDQGEWKERITYSRRGKRWYLSEVNSSKHFLLSSKKRDMEGVPLNINLQYMTDQIRTIPEIPDSLDMLPTGTGWQVGAYLNDRYDSAFWKAFDRSQGVTTGGSWESPDIQPPLSAYAMSRLDTLQGTLTPIRTCFDVTWYHLDLEVLPEEEILMGSNVIRFRVTQPTKRIQLDLYSGMIIDSVEWRGTPLPFTREHNAVYLDFPEQLARYAMEEVKVFYRGRPVDLDPQIPMYAAFLWAEDPDGTPWLQAICQGYGASGWWPGKDHLSDEPDSVTLTYTVPSGLDVIANGRLRNKTPLPDNRTRYDWFVSYPINNYNVTLNAGNYEHIRDHYVSGGDTLDLDFYILDHHLDHSAAKLQPVKTMLRVFEKYFGPYPFPRDGFKLVEAPHAMEHQSCVAIDGWYFDDPNPPSYSNGQINYSVLLHESAHEWWGNSVSCTDNAELWIHESFARYAEALYIEDVYGYDASQAFINRMKSLVANRQPIIGPTGVNYVHHGDADMYEKGALMLNTLRHVIGDDEIWMAVLRGLQEEFRYHTVGTTDIVRFINRVTGTDYTYLFDQYLRFADIPELRIAVDSTGGGNYLSYRWATGVENFHMPIAYRTGDGEQKILFPTTEWQRTIVPVASVDDLIFDTAHFYIRVTAGEKEKD